MNEFFTNLPGKNLNDNAVQRSTASVIRYSMDKKKIIIFINLTGQNRALSGLKNIWPVIMTGDLLSVILSLVTSSLIVRLRRSFFFAFCVLNFAFSLVATLANLLLIHALTKASTLPTNVKKMLNCKKEENWGEAKGKRDDTVFSPLPLPFFPYFALATTHGLLLLLSPIFICQKIN